MGNDRYTVDLTEDELDMLNKAIEERVHGLELLEGEQSEIDDLESLQVKLNKERGIRQDLMDASDRGNEPMEFTETPRGYEARDRWARDYDDLNGAPESDDDR